ncbi:isoleucine--tRNA ligase [Candidatus Woesearchaeota archaeon]|nr:isoleucine--tRNA ligase [Candidatus Woesearchaeota archaeon]
MAEDKPQKYDPIKLEPEMLKFWEEKKIYQKAKSAGKGKQKFYFLDGPPYTSGKIHLGTAWNKPLKDMVLRYKRMKGFDVWDRAGYDMHGLPVELKVEEKVGIKFKEEIPGYGVAKFVEQCREFALSNLKIMNEDFRRLGVWMDFEDPYMSITSEFIEGEWWLIKKAHENKRLYQGLKSMHWCSHCATSLAKHELEYENVEDDSIFVKFQVKGKKDEYLIVWTTTPWTIAFNLGVMVHPDFEYLKIKVKADDGKTEAWIVAKGLAGVFMGGVVGREYEIIEEFRGEKLNGCEYVHPFSDLIDYAGIKKESPKVHTVVLSEEFVDLSAGTGLVHMAPGCGPEDFEIGRRNGIPAYNPVDEYGKYPEGMGSLSGMVCKKDDRKFTEELEKRGAIIASTKVQHEYAHCWRCQSPVIFRTTKQWFFKVEDLKEQMKKENRKINWVPEWAGSRQFDSWLDNLRDNGITRQRYWGTPIPIWACGKCDSIDVIGSVAELAKLAGSEAIPKDLHKPWIDEVQYKCKCGGTKTRIPDIADVWVDAGTTSWNCLRYPGNVDDFNRLFPADFILEGKDQIRGWFNLLLVASMVSMNRPSFKSVYMHGFVNDAAGRKMSKSQGNVISPYEVIDKYGADAFRYYTAGGANPGYDLNYNFDDVKLKRRNLEVLWNLQNFVLDLSKQAKLRRIDEVKGRFSIEEKYILSKLNSGIRETTLLYDKYHLNLVPQKIEGVFLELSRAYIQLVREKSSLGSEAEKEAVLSTVNHVLMECIKMFATVAPFISESVYQNMKDVQPGGGQKESIHLFQWPGHDDNMIDTKLEEEMEIVQGIIQATLSAREKARLGVRWPLKEVIVQTGNESVISALKNLNSLLKSQCNIRKVGYTKSFDKVKVKMELDVGKIGARYGGVAPKVIASLAVMNPEMISKLIEEEKIIEAKVDNELLPVPKDCLIFRRAVDQPYVESEYKSSYVYLNTEQTKELEAEGFAREIMRRIQQMRKNAGLQKQHSIRLFIKCGKADLDILSAWRDAIKEKVGAGIFEFSATEAAQDYTNKEVYKVKDKEFEISFDRA